MTRKYVAKAKPDSGEQRPAFPGIMEDETEIPGEFQCLICQDIMSDPVITADGHSYDRDCIKIWFSLNNISSPRTNLSLPNKVLISNEGLRMAIQSFLEKKDGVWNDRYRRALLDKRLALLGKFQCSFSRLKARAEKESLSYNTNELILNEYTKLRFFLEYFRNIEMLCEQGSITLSQLWGLSIDTLSTILKFKDNFLELINIAKIPLSTLSNNKHLAWILVDSKSLTRLIAEGGVSWDLFLQLPFEKFSLLVTELDNIENLICDKGLKWSNIVSSSLEVLSCVLKKAPCYYPIINEKSGVGWEDIFALSVDLLQEVSKYFVEIRNFLEENIFSWDQYIKFDAKTREFLCQHSTPIRFLVTEKIFTLQEFLNFSDDDREWILENDIKIRTAAGLKIVHITEMMQCPRERRSRVLRRDFSGDAFSEIKDQISTKEFLMLDNTDQDWILKENHRHIVKLSKNGIKLLLLLLKSNQCNKTIAEEFIFKHIDAIIELHKKGITLELLLEQSQENKEYIVKFYKRIINIRERSVSDSQGNPKEFLEKAISGCRKEDKESERKKADVASRFVQESSTIPPKKLASTVVGPPRHPEHLFVSQNNFPTSRSELLSCPSSEIHTKPVSATAVAPSVPTPVRFLAAHSSQNEPPPPKQERPHQLSCSKEKLLLATGSGLTISAAGLWIIFTISALSPTTLAATGTCATLLSVVVPPVAIAITLIGGLMLGLGIYAYRTGNLPTLPQFFSDHHGTSLSN